MKCLLTSYFFTLLLFWNINNVQLLSLRGTNTQSDEIKKLLDCKICQEMFQYEFNYEKLLNDDSKINIIKSLFEGISEQDFNFKGYFSKDNLEFVSKEISMEYFFKGEESQFLSEENLEKFKNCKNQKFDNINNNININNVNNNSDYRCEILKFKLCENLLSIEADLCTKFNERRDFWINKNKKNYEKENTQENIFNSEENNKNNQNNKINQVNQNSFLEKIKENKLEEIKPKNKNYSGNPNIQKLDSSISNKDINKNNYSKDVVDIMKNENDINIDLLGEKKVEKFNIERNANYEINKDNSHPSEFSNLNTHEKNFAFDKENLIKGNNISKQNHKLFSIDIDKLITNDSTNKENEINRRKYLNKLITSQKDGFESNLFLI